MGESCLAERFGRHVRLSDDEQETLGGFEDEDRLYRRGSVVIREHDPAREMFVVRSGWLHSSIVLGNGSRQIMHFHFAGDLVGLPLLVFPESPETVTAVTDVTLRPFTRDRLAGLITARPRLGALLLALTVAGRVSLSDRLASIGRTPARARVAALLCEIYTRLRAPGAPPGGPIALPLTQEEIGDATGLTAVHVNRMMRTLVEDGIIARTGSQLIVRDEARLRAEANFLDRTGIETGWLVNAR